MQAFDAKLGLACMRSLVAANGQWDNCSRADSSFVMKVDPKLFSYVGCTSVDGVSEAYSKVDKNGDIPYATHL